MKTITKNKQKLRKMVIKLEMILKIKNKFKSAIIRILLMKIVLWIQTLIITPNNPKRSSQKKRKTLILRNNYL